jgi:hypothetical protein
MPDNAAAIQTRVQLCTLTQVLISNPMQPWKTQQMRGEGIFFQRKK